MAYKKPENVPGLIRNEDGRFLEDLAVRVRPGHAIVEIGPFAGKSTAFLARGSSAHAGSVFIHSIDPWEKLDRPLAGTGAAIAPTRLAVHELFRTNVKRCGISERVVEHHDFSVNVARMWRSWQSARPIDLLYIDGDHKYDGVKADIETWLPLLDRNGIAVFDDYRTAHGVKRAVDELLSTGRWRTVPTNQIRFTVVCRTGVHREAEAQT